MAIHKVGAVDKKAAFLCVVIGEDPIVDEVPAESIGDYHDDALGIDTWFWLSYIGGKAVDRCDGASWDLGMDVAAETIGARS